MVLLYDIYLEWASSVMVLSRSSSCLFKEVVLVIVVPALGVVLEVDGLKVLASMVSWRLVKDLCS